MRSPFRPAIAVLTLALATALSAVAQTSPPGRLLASNCFQCHGTNGRGPGFDQLAGESAEEIVKNLTEMRAGKEGQGLMVKHAMGYTDAQIRQLAQWLATQR